MQKITPYLWFNDKAEEAMNFYCSIFKNAKVGRVSRQGPNGPVMMVTFELDGQQFYGLNGGPIYQFTEAVSFLINCETQAEVDDFWTKLSAGGSEGRCGWLKDRYGLSWQVVPSLLGKLMGDPDPAKAGRVVQAMLQMNKLDIAKLQQAADQG